MGQTFLKAAVVGVIILGAGLIYKAVKSASDPCELAKLQTSQTEIQAKDRSRMKLHLDYGYSTKLNKYLPHIKSAKSEVFYKKRWKSKPAMVSLTTNFKTEKAATSAYRYLKKKWESKRKSLHEVVQNGKSVIWYRNSYSTKQCFPKVVAMANDNLGVESTQEVQAPKEKMVAKAPHKVKKQAKKMRLSKKRHSKKLAKGH